jgi:hypothetical protein
MDRAANILQSVGVWILVDFYPIRSKDKGIDMSHASQHTLDFSLLGRNNEQPWIFPGVLGTDVAQDEAKAESGRWFRILVEEVPVSPGDSDAVQRNGALGDFTFYNQKCKLHTLI